jgi:hypothetical protein
MMTILAWLCVLSPLQTAPAASAPPLRFETEIPLAGVSGRFDHMAVDLERGRLYVAALGNDSLEVIDLEAGARVESVAGLGRPTGIALDPETGRFALATSRDGCCRVFAPELEVRARAERYDDADNVRFEPEQDRFYVGFGGALGVFALADAAEVASVEVGGHPESFQLDPGSPRVFVNVPARKAVVVVDRDRREVLEAWTLEEAGANYPMALDAARHRLLVGCRRPARLVVLDASSGETVASLPCCGDADDLFYDAARRRVYVSGGAGSIDVFEQKGADEYALLASVESAAGARTSLYVPESSRLYLAVPARGERGASIRVYAAGG